MARLQPIPMVFSSSTAMPVVVTAEVPVAVERSASAATDLVITIPFSTAPASVSAHSRVSWDELLGQR